MRQELEYKLVDYIGEVIQEHPHEYRTSLVRDMSRALTNVGRAIDCSDHARAVIAGLVEEQMDNLAYESLVNLVSLIEVFDLDKDRKESGEETLTSKLMQVIASREQGTSSRSRLLVSNKKMLPLIESLIAEHDGAL